MRAARVVVRRPAHHVVAGKITLSVDEHARDTVAIRKRISL